LVIKTQPASQFRVMRELRARLLVALGAEGITLPPAERNEIWVHGVDADDQAQPSG
jgi:hypothetical protein